MKWWYIILLFYKCDILMYWCPSLLLYCLCLVKIINYTVILMCSLYLCCSLWSANMNFGQMWYFTFSSKLVNICWEHKPSDCVNVYFSSYPFSIQHFLLFILIWFDFLYSKCLTKECWYCCCLAISFFISLSLSQIYILTNSIIAPDTFFLFRKSTYF